MKWLSFITQFKSQFLLPFTGCRKVLEKMSERSFAFLFLDLVTRQILAHHHIWCNMFFMHAWARWVFMNDSKAILPIVSSWLTFHSYMFLLTINLDLSTFNRDCLPLFLGHQTVAVYLSVEIPFWYSVTVYS